MAKFFVRSVDVTSEVFDCPKRAEVGDTETGSDIGSIDGMSEIWHELMGSRGGNVPVIGPAKP